MGADTETEEFKAWKENAFQILKDYYLSFAGCQWHEFDRVKDTALLRAKICYAMFGPPTVEADDIETSYSVEQKDTAWKVLKMMLKVHTESKVEELRVGFIFVSCKKEGAEFVLPLFSVFVGCDQYGHDRRHFVDVQCRIYKSWDDWKKNNCLPKLDYAYPCLGFFTCSGDNKYEFDEERDPDVEYGKSPQAGFWSRLLKKTDGVAIGASLGVGVVSVIALFTPLAPVVITGAAVVGISSASYGAARGINRLVDKRQHGESLADIESVTLWLGLASAPLHFMTSFVNSTLTLGAQQGQFFGSSMRAIATVINVSTLGLDSVLLGIGLAKLIKKASEKELTPLDVLQFSMSVFFYTNTLMQPKVASDVIRKAQEQRVDRAMTEMSDQQAKDVFRNFLAGDRGRGPPIERSNVIKSIKRLDDPSKFFKKAKRGDADDGRKVTTTEWHGETTRADHGRDRCTDRIRSCYGREMDGIELNGLRIFKDMTDAETRIILRTFGDESVRCNGRIVRLAHEVSEQLGHTTVDKLASVIVVVNAELADKSDDELTEALDRLEGPGVNEFVTGLYADITAATALATANGLHFDNPLTAVQHLRKLGAEYPGLLKKFGDRIDIYLGSYQDAVTTDLNLKEVCKLSDGTKTKIYATDEGRLGVVTSSPNSTNINAIFHKAVTSQELIQRLAKRLSNSNMSPLSEPYYDAAKRLARVLGLRTFHVYVTVESKWLNWPVPIEQCAEIDLRTQEQIAHLLNSIADSVCEYTVA